MTELPIVVERAVRRAGAVVAVALLTAFASAACDSDTPTALKYGSEPSPSIGGVTVAMSGAAVPVSTVGCATPVFIPPVSVVVVSSVSNAFLDTVTLHLLDGSNVGASVTIPRAGLDAQFGNTVVVLGNRRVFTFTPTFGCFRFQPHAMRAEVVIGD